MEILCKSFVRFHWWSSFNLKLLITCSLSTQYWVMFYFWLNEWHSMLSATNGWLRPSLKLLAHFSIWLSKPISGIALITIWIEMSSSPSDSNEKRIEKWWFKGFGFAFAFVVRCGFVSRISIKNGDAVDMQEINRREKIIIIIIIVPFISCTMAVTRANNANFIET